MPFPLPGDLPDPGMEQHLLRLLHCRQIIYWQLPGSSAGKESTCSVGGPGSIPGLGRSAGEGQGYTPVLLGFPGGSAGKESTCNVGDLGSIPGLGRSPGAGKGYPLQCSELENSMDCIVHGVTKSRTRLSGCHFTLPLAPPLSAKFLAPCYPKWCLGVFIQWLCKSLPGYNLIVIYLRWQGLRIAELNVIQQRTLPPGPVWDP